MNKQELFERISHLPSDCSGPSPMINKLAVLEFIKSLNEPQKVTVPQFVADWIEEAKKEGYSIFGAINKAPKGEVEGWLELQNVEIFAEAWVNGYEVKKEKRYEVILSNGQSLKTVYRQGKDRLDFEKVYGDLERFTRKQLEDAGLAWVFDCPGVKVKEVEE